MISFTDTLESLEKKVVLYFDFWSIWDYWSYRNKCQVSS